VGAYANCAAAMRRQVYLTTPGFLPFFQHMYEEPDYGLQCYAAGYAVWFEPSVEIVHARSAMNRPVIRRHHLNARNELWSVWLRCPWPWLPVVAAYRAARQLVHAFFQGPQWVIREPWWWWEAFKGIGVCRERRRAIPWRTYYGWMRLARHPLYCLDDLTVRFPTSPASAIGLSRRVVRRPSQSTFR
jgi:GT2 family glycosyltransferase